MQDVIAGHIDAVFITIAAAQAQVAAGNVKALGLTTHERIQIAPDIPTMDEAGLHGFYFALWAAIFAPKGTPKDIIDNSTAPLSAFWLMQACGKNSRRRASRFVARSS